MKEGAEVWRGKVKLIARAFQKEYSSLNILILAQRDPY
jgi:hypothetical protein